MRPLDIQHIGNELAIKWPDGRRKFHSAGNLAPRLSVRRCKGETDILGNVYKNPEQTLTPRRLNWSESPAWAVMPSSRSGRTAIDSGIFSFDYLQQVGRGERTNKKRRARWSAPLFPFTQTYDYIVAFWLMIFWSGSVFAGSAQL